MALWQGFLTALVVSWCYRWFFDIKLNPNTTVRLSFTSYQTPLIVSHRSSCNRLPLVDTTECGEEPECNPHAKYRSIDGSCSNLKHPAWGQAGRTFARVVPATYHDGKSKPRRSVGGASLPPVRNLSSGFCYDKIVPDQINTLNVMQWGQLLAHDVTHNLPNYTTESGKSCCTTNNRVPASGDISVNCLPIEVPSDDIFYSQFNVKCLNFSRASSATNGTCYKYPIEQINDVTSVIDASMVYGSDSATAKKLRTFSNGKLRVQAAKDGRHFLPNASNPTISCPNSPVCYLAGDDRVNQNTDITVYQILLMRLHNYLCEELLRINPYWNDEKLYQEARRIVGAFIQHVTYSHFLPNILGSDYTKARELSLDPDPNNCRIYYDSSVNPSTYTEFGGAAYRSFHSLVPREVVFMDKNYEPSSYVNMDDFYFRPFFLQEPKVLDMCLRGLVSQPQQVMDLHVTTAVRNMLFKGSKKWGNDLESTDMMRGREMGLPTYNQMRHICGLKRADCFEDFQDVMSEESIQKLKSFYSSAEDVDLFIGAILEELVSGTLVGPTNQCIIGEQFYNYMRGDRFFYRNCGLPWALTTEQLKTIYQTSVAWMFCAVGDDFSAVQYDTFHRVSKSNPIVPCKKIQGLDLSPWKE